MKELVLLFLLTPFNGFVSAKNSEPIKPIDSRLDLISAIKSAHDGDTIYVDDIDFVSNTDGLYNVYERIDINKSITLVGKESKSLFNHGSFNILAGKTSDQKAVVKFENIIFKEYEVANTSITASDWEDEASLQYASFFSGNADVTYSNCEFTGYRNEEGGALFAKYNDYSSNPINLELYGDQTACKLNLYLDNCLFNNNAAYHSGGAIHLDAYQKNVSLHISNSEFTNNISGVYSNYGFGGGAIYANGVDAHIKNSHFKNNLANHIYSGNSISQDRSKGGALAFINSGFELNNVTIASNRASLGGGLYASNTTGKIISSTIERNLVKRIEGNVGYQGKYTNEELGGAIAFEGRNGDRLTILNSDIINNESSNVYSGIYFSYSKSMPNYIDMYLSSYVNKKDPADTFDIDEDKPDDMFAIKDFNVKGCAIIDGSYDEEEMFPQHSMPSAENGFCYVAGINKAIDDKVVNKDDKGDYAIELSSFDIDLPKEIVEEIFKDYASKLDKVSFSSRLAGSTNINLFDYDKKLVKKETINTFEEMDLENLNDSFFKKFKNWQDDNKNIYDDKIVSLFDSSINEINLYATFIYTSNFYLLVIGLPVLVLFISAITIFTIMLFKKRGCKKCNGSTGRVSYNLNEEEINDIMNKIKTIDFTNREREVVKLILENKARRDIAKALCVSEATIKTHVNHIYSKLGVNTRTEFINNLKKM